MVSRRLAHAAHRTRGGPRRSWELRPVPPVRAPSPIRRGVPQPRYSVLGRTAAPSARSVPARATRSTVQRPAQRGHLCCPPAPGIRQWHHRRTLPGPHSDPASHRGVEGVLQTHRARSGLALCLPAPKAAHAPIATRSRRCRTATAPPGTSRRPRRLSNIPSSASAIDPSMQTRSTAPTARESCTKGHSSCFGQRRMPQQRNPSTSSRFDEVRRLFLPPSSACDSRSNHRTRSTAVFGPARVSHRSSSECVVGGVTPACRGGSATEGPGGRDGRRRRIRCRATSVVAAAALPRRSAGGGAGR